MLSAFISSLRTADLRRKILFTLGMIVIYRIGAGLPSPGVNYQNVNQCIEQLSGGAGAQLYSLINLFSGGALLQLSVFAVGVMGLDGGIFWSKLQTGVYFGKDFIRVLLKQ